MENLTAALFSVGVIACAIANYLGCRVRIAIVWLVLCVIFLGEEVSWFQRVFGYSVPAVEAINAQGEFNLHNIGNGERFLEGGEFRFEFEKLFYSQNLFRAGFLGFFLIVPVLVSFSARFRAFMDWWHYARPSNGFLLAIWTIIALSFVLTVISPELTRNSVAEVREFYFSAIICIYTIMLAAPNGLSGFVRVREFS